MEPILAAAYGTSDTTANRQAVEDVAKCAGIGSKAIVGLGAVGLSALVAKAIQRKRQEAEIVNAAAQELEARRMRPAIYAMQHTRVPPIIPQGMGGYFPVGMDEGMIRMASAIGSDMAQMEKDAFGSPFGALAQGAKNTLSGVAAGASKWMNVNKATNFANAAKNYKPGLGTQVSRGIENVGAKLTDMGNRAAGVTPKFTEQAKLQRLNRMRDTAAKSGLMQKSEQAASTVARTPVQTLSRGAVVPAQQAASTASQGIQHAAGATAGVAGAAGAAAGSSPSGWLQRTGLFDNAGNFRKGRALAAAGIIGAGYLGLKAAKKGIDYMTKEPAPANYNTGGNQLAMGVNQYGNPQF